jgi:hypothetical protein
LPFRNVNFDFCLFFVKLWKISMVVPRGQIKPQKYRPKMSVAMMTNMDNNDVASTVR